MSAKKYVINKKSAKAQELMRKVRSLMQKDKQ